MSGRPVLGRPNIGETSNPLSKKEFRPRVIPITVWGAEDHGLS